MEELIRARARGPGSGRLVGRRTKGAAAVGKPQPRILNLPLVQTPRHGLRLVRGFVRVQVILDVRGRVNIPRSPSRSSRERIRANRAARFPSPESSVADRDEQDCPQFLKLDLRSRSIASEPHHRTSLSDAGARRLGLAKRRVSPLPGSPLTERLARRGTKPTPQARSLRTTRVVSVDPLASRHQ